RQLTEQIRPAGSGCLKLVPAPPAGDSRMIARLQHLWHRPPSKVAGARVVGMLQPSLLQGLPAGRALVAEHPGKQGGDGVDPRQRRQLATGDDEIPDRDLPIDVLNRSLVDALVASAYQYQPRFVRGQLARQRLTQWNASGAGQEYPRAW